jgi:hypothetical protein
MSSPSSDVTAILRLGLLLQCCTLVPSSLLNHQSFITVSHTPCWNVMVGHPTVGVANFFQDPPSPWVHFFSCWQRHTARCLCPYQSSSAPVVSTMACSLGTSLCSATASDFPQLASKSIVSILSKLS